MSALVPSQPMSLPSLSSTKASLIDLADPKLFQEIEISNFPSSSMIFCFVLALIHLKGAVLNILLILESLE